MFQDTPGCPTGWIEHSGRCYKISTEEKSWEEADEYCRSNEVRTSLYHHPHQPHQGPLGFHRQSRGTRLHIHEYK